MKLFGNIYLTWKKGPGSRRIPIAKISNGITKGVRFKYLLKNIDLARTEGFSYFAGFSKIDLEYSENVLEILGQRITKSERNDLKEFYNFWIIDALKKNDIFYMLGMTQGLLPTDNFEFLADFNPIKDHIFVSEITNLSNSRIPSNFLKIGDELKFRRDPKNSFDNKAVEVYYGQTKLGYLKTIHSRVFYKTNNSPKITIHHLEKNGFIKRAFVKIQL
jgi:hypothetical protein